MIVCTRTVDTLARRAFGKENVAVNSVDKIFDLFAIDPAIQKPVRDGYVISTDDVKNPRLNKAFTAALGKKHPAACVILVVRGKGTSNWAEVPGINVLLQNPKPEELAQAVASRTHSISAKIDEIQSSADVLITPGFVPPEFRAEETPKLEYHEPEASEELEPLPEVDLPTWEEEPVQEEHDSIAERIKACQRVSDVHALTAEIKSTEVIKSLIRENAEFSNLEAKLTALQDKIYAIIADVTVPNLSDKLEKIRALLYDKDYYKAKSNTIIEQRIEEIIKILVMHTQALLNKRLKELDAALVVRQGATEKDLDFPRLQGIADERANVMLELAVMEKELKNIGFAADGLIMETASSMAEGESSPTNNELLDSHLKARGIATVSEQSMDLLKRLLTVAIDTSTAFQKAGIDIVAMKKSLYKLCDLSKEEMVAQAKCIQYLAANNVEDTVIAETLIKKSMRVFVAEEGAGSTVVPLVLSHNMSRQSANTLLVDLTGYAKFSDYGVETLRLEDWMETKDEKEFCVVEGNRPASPEAVQRILTALTKAAIYYRCIHVIVAPEDKQTLDMLAPDVLSISYVVTPENRTLVTMKEVIENTGYENVARHVLINKYASSAAKILEVLGIIDNLDIHVARIPYTQALVECALEHVTPFEAAVVKEAFKEAEFHA